MTVGWLLVAMALAWGRAPRRPVLRRRRSSTSNADPLELAQLLTIALAAGRPLGDALEAVRRDLSASTAGAVDDVLRRTRLVGLARALIATEGPLSDLCRRLARAQLTGAPTLSTVRAYADSLHDSRRARSLEGARTMGVRLIVPVALLLLPGFVALVIGPYVLEQFEWLTSGVAP